MPKKRKRRLKPEVKRVQTNRLERPVLEHKSSLLISGSALSREIKILGAQIKRFSDDTISKVRLKKLKVRKSKEFPLQRAPRRVKRKKFA